MKKYLILAALCFTIILISIYGRIINLKYRPVSAVETTCSPNKKICSQTFGVGCEDCFAVSYKIDTIIKDMRTGQFATLSTFATSDDLKDAFIVKSVWKNNNQLDIYIQNTFQEGVLTYFYKGLGNLNVVLHYTKKDNFR